MVVKRSAEIAATSRADDLALRALAEIVAITSDENVRIVGGQMVALLMAAFPVSGISPRRTRDADTAITTEPDRRKNTQGGACRRSCAVRAAAAPPGPRTVSQPSRWRLPVSLRP